MACSSTELTCCSAAKVECSRLGPHLGMLAALKQAAAGHRGAVQAQHSFGGLRLMHACYRCDG